MMKDVAGKMATFSLLPLFLFLFFSFPQKAMAAEGKIGMQILSESAAVNRESKWEAEIKIENQSDSSLSSGFLEARSSTMPISSLSAMNLWAKGTMNLATPVVLDQIFVPSLSPGAFWKANLQGLGNNLGSQWGPRPLEFFFTSSLKGSPISYNLNSFVTVTSSSPLPALPLSLLYIVPGPTEADKKGAQSLVFTGKGKALLQTPQNFPPSLEAEEKIQVIEDKEADLEFDNASAIEQPAEASLIYLWRMRSQAAAWKGRGDLPQILVSSSSVSASQLAESASLGYDAALEEGGESQTFSLPHGKITLLSANSLLSALAGGNPSSVWAEAEQTEAGREARFVAQLACLRGKKDPVIVETSLSSLPLFSFLSGEKWISFKTLKEDLAWNWPISSLTSSQTKGQGKIQSPFSKIALFSSLSSDPKAATWAKAVEKEADYAQLCSYSQNSEVRKEGRKALSYINAALNRCIRLSTSNNITVLSESASLPVTVKNLLPFPIRAQIRSMSSNSQIVILPEKESKVGSKMEIQIDFPVQIHSSIRGEITFWIGGFYHPVTKISTQLNSHLAVTRLNVMIAIIPAALLTILGCIRQARRKKKNG